MLKVALVDSGSNKQVHILPGLSGRETFITATLPNLWGHFAAATRATEGSTTIISPDIEDSLLLTDLIVSTKKSNGNSLVINFTDGTNTVKIVEFDVTIAIAFGMSFGGRFHGWEDAYIQMTTDAAYNATVTVGYMKVPKLYTLKYAAWNAAR